MARLVRQQTALIGVLTFTLFGASGGPPAARSAPLLRQSVMVLEDVNLLTMSDSTVTSRQTVLVRGERIADIYPAGSRPAPDSARVVNGAGQYLMPGLTDMHVHVHDEGDLPLFLAYGVTSVRDMDGSLVRLDLREREARGVLTGPTMYVAGPILYGEEAGWKEEPSVIAAAERIVGEEARAGYDAVKVYWQLSSKQYAALASAANRHDLPVVGHVPWSVGLAGALAGRQHTIEHLTGYDDALESPSSPVQGKRTAWYQVLRYGQADDSRLPALAQATAEAGTWNTPTLVQMEQLAAQAETRRLLASPIMRYMHPDELASWQSFSRYELPSWDSMSVADTVALRTAVRQRRAIVRALYQAGAGILAGTDVPGRFLVPGSSLQEEIRCLVAAGLTPYDALRAATTNAAMALGVERESGTIAVGKRADLVLFRKNPLLHIADLGRPSGVLHGGRWFSEGELTATLDSIVRTRRRG